MPDQPDFTENTDILAAMSPEDVAELEARMQDIASRPAPTPENRERFTALREGSQDRVDAKLAAAEEVNGPLFFDTSTPEGHIDAVTFVRTTLLGVALEVQDRLAVDDQVGVSDLFQQAHDLWEPLTPAVQFNVLLEFLMATAATGFEEPDES